MRTVFISDIVNSPCVNLTLWKICLIFKFKALLTRPPHGVEDGCLRGETEN